MPGPVSPAAADADAVERRRAAFVRGWSLEATRPSAAELSALRDVLHPSAAIYLSAVASRPHAELAATAASARGAGFEPVPHVAARSFATPASLGDFLTRLAGEAHVRRVLLVAGDIDHSGPFADALAVLRTEWLPRCGIEEVGIAGYPEGHPRIEDAVLAQALEAKIEAAHAAALRVHIVTQFCFDPGRIVDWLGALRQSGIAAPVQVGIIGPTSLPTLLRFAQRCGVRASARGLMRSGFARALVGDSSPDALLEALLRTDAEIGDIAPHFFSFGGVLRTARYGRDAADKHFALKADEGSGRPAAAPRP